MKNIDFTDFFNVFLSGATIRRVILFALLYQICAATMFFL